MQDTQKKEAQDLGGSPVGDIEGIRSKKKMKSAYLEMLPNTALVDYRGTTQHLHDLIRGNLAVISMFYSRCARKCIPSAKNLVQVYSLLRKEQIEKHNVRFLSISLDPQIDREAALREFRRVVGAEQCAAWNFFTGAPNEVLTLRTKLGMYEAEPEVEAFKANHSAHILILNEAANRSVMAGPFENPLNILRKIFQLVSAHVGRHDGAKLLRAINTNQYGDAQSRKLFANILTLHTMFTLPFLPPNLKVRFVEEAKRQRSRHFDGGALSD